MIQEHEPSNVPASAASDGGPSSARAFLWPLGAWLLLAAACYGLMLPGRTPHHLSDFGGHTLYLSYIGLTALLLIWHIVRTRQPWPWIGWMFSAGLGTFACVQLFKTFLPLARPPQLTGPVKHDGFPSGHTTCAFALAWLLTRIYPRLAPLWYALAVSIGWSRVEGSAHYPYQVLWGALFGTLIGWLISRFLRPRPVALVANERVARDGVWPPPPSQTGD